MQKVVENKKKGYLLSLLPLSIIFAVYMFVFILSMDTAFDREQYIRIMTYPFVGREEPLIHVLSYILGFIIYDPSYKLILIQFFFIQLLVMILLKKGKMYNAKNLVKMLFFCVIFLGVFSNMIGVQLRIGYATIIFLFVIFYMQLKPKIINIPFFILPCIMHSALIPSVIIFYIIHFIKINNGRKFATFFIISVIIMTLTIKALPMLFDALGINSYYYSYLEDGDFGRSLPFSIVFYLIFALLSLFTFNKIIRDDMHYWFGMSGLILVYLGLILDFYVAFKMLVPISAFLYLYLMDKAEFRHLNSQAFLALVIALMPLSFLMLSNQVGLI